MSLSLNPAKNINNESPPYYPQVCHRINCSTVLSALSVLISDSNSKKRDNIYYAKIRCT